MPGRTLLGVFVLLSGYVFSHHAMAQVVPVPAPLPRPGAVARPQQPHQQPCWEVAGVSKSALEQRRSIQQRTRSEVEAVCADSSLTPQQRQQKIRQIHEQAKQEVDALITPQQTEAMKSCQASRNRGAPHPGIGHPSTVAHGPCGELPSTTGPNPPPTGSKPEPEIEN
jgi:type IV secretory pathway VirB10-like protein